MEFTIGVGHEQTLLDVFQILSFSANNVKLQAQDYNKGPGPEPPILTSLHAIHNKFKLMYPSLHLHEN